MKAIWITLLLIPFCINIQGQNTASSKFDLAILVGIGYAKVKNETQPNYNLNVTTSSLIVNYDFSKHFEISSGFELQNMSGNGIFDGENFYQDRVNYKIPLLFSYISNFYPVSFKVNIGPYFRGIIKNEYQFVTYKENSLYIGSTFGFQIGFGFEYSLCTRYEIGIYYNSESDLTKMKSKAVSGISDKQLIESMNTIEISFSLNL